jgi:hypothetical protein
MDRQASGLRSYNLRRGEATWNIGGSDSQASKYRY